MTTKKYEVREVTSKILVLDKSYSNYTLLENGNKKVTGSSLPSIGSNRFNVVRAGSTYAFGCSEGKFTYDMLLKTIKEAETANSTASQVDGLKPKKGGNTIKSEVVDESGDYYITKSGRALAKDKYDKVKVDVETNDAFGKFKWQKNGYYGDQYFYGDRVAGSRKDILEALYQAKAIIDFLEDKGDYAPIVEAEDGNKEVEKEEAQ